MSQRVGVWIALVQSVVAMLGSLFVQYGMGLPPCILCWYQRIALFPLVIILGVGLVRRDRGVVWYALPLAGVGFLISLYHNALYFGLLPDTRALCVRAVSCTTERVEMMGFVTIPLLGLVAFVVILLALVSVARRKK
ncbi:MAG: disulfide bond formation protein B [Patescibacteria group bacterium]